eukprot:1158472-Pelagomonas_calceolata.AAC.2
MRVVLLCVLGGWCAVGGPGAVAVVVAAAVGGRGGVAVGDAGETCKWAEVVAVVEAEAVSMGAVPEASGMEEDICQSGGWLD